MHDLSSLKAAIPSAAWMRPLGLDCPNAAVAADVPEPLIDDGPYQGLPLGGLGAGAVGRSFRGDWSRWHLEVGQHTYAPAWANQFSVFWQQGDTSTAQVLCTAAPDAGLPTWRWRYPVGAGTYHALFPRAWYVYDHPDWPIVLMQEQLSPILPGNLRETSFPVAALEWHIVNRSNQPLRVGLMLTWEHALSPVASLQGLKRQHSAWDTDTAYGIVLGQQSSTPNDGRSGSQALAVARDPGYQITRWPFWEIEGDAAAIWRDFSRDGRLDDRSGQRSANGQRSAAALCVTLDLPANGSARIPFSLAWDFPVAAFGPDHAWAKRYTRFWGDSGQQAAQLADHTLQHYQGWRAEISAWQEPILSDQQRPDWYKTALFNELYYLLDGGTLWVDHKLGSPPPPPDHPGWFSYLECFDYPFYGTLDVSFYSSWSVLALWPELERQELRQFAATVNDADLVDVTIQATGEIAPRKCAGALPHDLGAPFEQPLERANAYSYQNINVWKDLNLKYVLRVFRDITLLPAPELLPELWPSVKAAIDYVRQFDSDGDGLLDHSGADQTYDTWAMTGASPYSASLLIAALDAAASMATSCADSAAQGYRDWADQARTSLVQKLWNGAYFDYHTADNALRHVIMADQLVGQWYAGALDLPPVVDPQLIQTALQTIYQHNVLQYAHGALGAVNGMFPDGTVDTSSNQASEVWSGTTYALAALMLQSGLTEAGWRTAWGAYNATYIELGLWFRTPEAWGQERTFRASMYMRPQSIWAIEHALKRLAAPDLALAAR